MQSQQNHQHPAAPPPPPTSNGNTSENQTETKDESARMLLEQNVVVLVENEPNDRHQAQRTPSETVSTTKRNALDDEIAEGMNDPRMTPIRKETKEEEEEKKKKNDISSPAVCSQDKAPAESVKPENEESKPVVPTASIDAS